MFEMQGQTIEIEDKMGNTIGALEIDISFDGNICINNMIGFDIADEDEDDIFNSHGKVRIQANGNI